jgi:transposase
MGSGEIQIEFPGGIIARFSGMAESHAAMQLLTQIYGHHVLPE